jgi:cytochrome c oxidase cbb3-type subunit I/II
MLYWMVPLIFNTKLYSKKLANTHFWIATLGILIYAIPLYWAAVTQWLMLREYTPEGFLAYPNFLETLTQVIPMYVARIVGGTLFVTGFIIMLYNMVKTVKSGSFVDNVAAEAPALVPLGVRNPHRETVHRWLERKGARFSIIAFVVLAIGGAVEIIPMVFFKSNIPTIDTVTPYSPLELEGRDIYVSEGCYVCHSQMVRPFRSETDRYGEYSKIGEFVYDHPFQWGSRRIGPDLARAGVIGGPMYKNAAWHYNHFMDPQKMNAQSTMPKYPWLEKKEINLELTPAKIRAMQTLGVPYPEGYDQVAVEVLRKQGAEVAANLLASGIEVSPVSQMVAMIAYLHKLGRDISQVPGAAGQEAELIPVTLPASQSDLDAGKENYIKICAACHGIEGAGIPPAFPSLVDGEWLHGSSPEEVVRSIANGYPEKGMIAYKNQLPANQIEQVAAYILKVLNNEAD